MPIYEYECGTCNHSFEERQGYDAESIQKCPQCQNTAKRLVHASPIIFKGSGFYVTDYASKSSTLARQKDAEKEKSGNSGDTTETKAGTEPKAAKETKPAKESKSTSEPKAAKPVAASKNAD